MEVNLGKNPLVFQSLPYSKKYYFDFTNIKKEEEEKEGKVSWLVSSFISAIIKWNLEKL